MQNDKEVFYEIESMNKEIIVIFKDGIIVEDEEAFRKSHYFKNEENTSITTIFKDELLELFEVDNIKELKQKIDNKIRLLFKVGFGEMCYDKQTNTVVVYTESFKKDVVDPANNTRKLKRTIEKLSKEEKVTSSEFLNVIKAVSKGIDDIVLTEKDKMQISKIIPKMIKEGNIKISLKDVTDINKDRLKDIVQLGRDLLEKKNGIEKKLGIERKHIGNEYAWQKYFELYASYLLFGSIEQKIPESLINVDSKIRTSDSKLDILTINRYGFLDIVELKKSEEYLFKLDSSHDNFVPTSNLSTAIAQVNNYLMLLPHSETNNELINGAESATGMLVIGSNKYLMKKESILSYQQKTGMSANEIDIKLRKALRDLNYSYAHIQIVLYDELLDNLENFINQMSIEIRT
ncbi:Shedu anti-phage system protein SduA domain-containing protein [Anaerorhabdus furcosa]|uniref:Shedu protein SduA C-terminal domain-containing protein n=1 Tax=Anaerorhabdus furcosa TaxID=118967 RepID=A0A1T4M2M0_9FIRM|nr:Shedu anti-phage system protein SduA domain-containing protein [Anaerorhabdus furcosa]SJZ61249.1 protein of unknown function [Anaerorhabdus furcosa]